MPFPASTNTDKFYNRTPQSQGWLQELLLFTGSLCALCVLIWLGLRFGYEPYLNSKVKKLNDSVAQFGQQVSLSDQQNIVSFYSQLQNLKVLLQNHVFVSPVFAWLEKNTEQHVSYSKLGYNPTVAKLNLTGTARSGDDLVQELSVLQGQPNVDRILFNTVSVSATGTWAFDFSVFFNAPFPGFPTVPPGAGAPTP